MAPRSRTGCLTCRSRKLKCSEERPVCAQCAKANRECIPSSGITFRHQQNPSMNAGDDGEGGLKSFYGYKETFGKNTTWVDVPSDLTFIHTTNPYEDEEDGPGGSGGYAEGDTSYMREDREQFDERRLKSEYDLPQTSYPAYATQGLEALSAVASQGQYNYAPAPPAISQNEHTSSQMAATSPQHHSAAARPDLDYILNPASSVSPAMNQIDPHLQPTSPSTLPSMASPESFHPKLEHVRSYSSHSFSSSHERSNLHAKRPNLGHDRGTAIEDPELAFLLRNYSERIGHWMDIFDLSYFFSTRVPILAIKCPLLLYSCVSLSAKGLAKVDGRKPKMGGQISDARQSKMETWPGPLLSGDARLHRARQYYDVAVSLLRQALSGASKPRTHSLPEEASPNTISNASGYPLPRTDSDELIAATAILCVYEFFDVSRPEWSRHLDGAKSLFDIANDRMADLTRPPSPVAALAPLIRPLPTSDSSRALLAPNLRAVFWCFARQDMLWAFINHTVTRVDTADLSIWRSAGLKIAPDGSVYPSNPLHQDYLPDQAMADDMVSNTLIWLLAKLVNLMVAPEVGPGPLSPMAASARQNDLQDSWDSLDAQLRAWYEGLPPSFSPTAVKLSSSNVADIEEKWFPRPQCASTMQWWHFARIQLLNSRPQVSTSQLEGSNTNPGQVPAFAQRHANYQSILRQSRAHAKEIVAIGQGRSDEGSRVHGVQPLWTAGLVLGTSEEDDASPETEMWRRNIVSQLRGIEKDMGWASEYRVQSLLQTWQLPPDWGGDLPD